MADPTDSSPRRRRRGPELEAALLEAVWDELVELGFAGLTMESVAARAHTGIAVLYRRWANKDQLVFAAIEHYGATHPLEIADTGTLRGDLVALLAAFGRRATFISVAVAAAFSGLLAGVGMTPAQARERLLGERPALRDHVVYRRAAQRGEIDLDAIPDAVLAMPFDLLRHDMLMNLEPVEPARIEEIVDELVLPLIARHAADCPA
jgi:AcrR family transcriptional regulator